MFTKLRNKFLILNMSITSLVIIAAFAIIYFITYSNIHTDIQNKLNSRVGIQTTIFESSVPDDTGKKGAQSTHESFSEKDPFSFQIEVDTEGKILNINSMFDIPNDAYKKAVMYAWSHKKNNSTIPIEGKQWKYAITQISKHVIQGNGQEYTVKENKYQITFLDVTESKKTLFKLLTTLLLVGIITLIVIFFVSFYFANRSIKPLSEAWEKQKQFVADASHELKTPLSIINANYDALLANQEETIKSQLKWLGYIRIGTDRMTRLINDLLSLAKIEDVNMVSQKTLFNMSNEIKEVILSMEAVILEKGIKLSHSIVPDIIVKSDLERVKQVVVILLDNAIKYSNENGLVDISLKRTKRQVIFTIKNSGKGIAKQDLPKIFDRFYRADLSRTHENGGYGLGLSIAKSIINRLGGQIHVTSVENEYTIFTFTLGL